MVPGLKVLVTGGAGFIGSNLVYALLKQGCSVAVLDNFYTGSKKNLANCLAHIELFQEDITQVDIFGLGSFDLIFHLACPASPAKYQADPLFTVQTSYFGTLKVLEYARSTRCKVIFASTSEVYGDPQVHPQVETYFGNVNPVGPRACYDEGKRVAETLCYIFHKQFDVQVIIARIFNTYGPNMAVDDGRVISSFITNALRGTDLVIYGSGHQTRSFCYVSDCVAGLLSLAFLDDKFGVFNLGNDHEIEILELAKLVLNLTNSQSGISFVEAPQDDPAKRRPDISKLITKTGWKPQVSLEEGLKATIEYFKNEVA